MLWISRSHCLHQSLLQEYPQYSLLTLNASLFLNQYSQFLQAMLLLRETGCFVLEDVNWVQDRMYVLLGVERRDSYA